MRHLPRTFGKNQSPSPGAAQDTNSKNSKPAKRPTRTRVDFPGLPRTRSGSPFGKLTQKLGKISKINCVLTRPRIAEISTLKCSRARPLCCSDAPLPSSNGKHKINHKCLVRGRPRTRHSPRLGEQHPADFRQKSISVSWRRAGHHTSRFSLTLSPAPAPDTTLLVSVLLSLLRPPRTQHFSYQSYSLSCARPGHAHST